MPERARSGSRLRRGPGRNSAAMVPRSQSLLCPMPIDVRPQAPVGVADIARPPAILARWQVCNLRLSPVRCQAGSRRPRPTADRSVPKSVVPRAGAQARPRQRCTTDWRQTAVQAWWRPGSLPDLLGPPFPVEPVRASYCFVLRLPWVTIALRVCNATKLNGVRCLGGMRAGRTCLHRALVSRLAARGVALMIRGFERVVFEIATSHRRGCAGWSPWLHALARAANAECGGTCRFGA